MTFEIQSDARIIVVGHGGLVGSAVSRPHELGWKHSIDLRECIESTYGWFLDNVDSGLRGMKAS